MSLLRESARANGSIDPPTAHIQRNVNVYTFTDGWIIVAMVGDITGPDGWPDGKVDMINYIRTVAKNFGKTDP